MFDHEGDWEMIQVHLDSVGTPTGATYAQHNTGEYCTWNNVELSPTGRPVVYVAHESHASYFWGGDHRIVVDNLPDQWDYADGAGESLVPDVIQLDPLVPPLWMQWPGKWGGADSSPKAPPHQDKWADPLAFQADASACTSAPPSLRRRADTEVLRPAAPLVKARRVGNRVVVDYRLTRPPGTAEPWLLVTTLDGFKDRYTPTSARTVVEGRMTGRVVQPIRLARGPLRIIASVRAKNGARSKLVVVRVKQ